MTNRFHAAMRLMRKHDPQLQEDGFAQLVPLAAGHIAELIEEFEHEHEHGLRCWLLELIGEARSPAALPLLEAQLHGDDEALRGWAVTGLNKLGTHEARTLLWRARANGTIT
ncbi:HEAT repeat domain-containing protein [Nocardia farcinica]|uniref:HEAT repeat domain-containing protein n=1 Tax=Nocardia farcinica TaxID=37329 RepID=UPI00245713BF|nr:HEAT repeat domain-containing protein [Nocardia farcinica]